MWKLTEKMVFFTDVKKHFCCNRHALQWKEEVSEQQHRQDLLNHAGREVIQKSAVG